MIINLAFFQEDQPLMPLLRFTDLVTDACGNNKYISGIFLYLFKAFDTLLRNILLSKLHHYGIRSPTHRWLSNYLSPRV